MGEGQGLIVITADQRASRRHADAVPGALEALAALPTATLPRSLPFERTAGDEIQGVTPSAEAAVDTIGTLLRTGQWQVGIGLGPVEEPLPRSVRSARGPAFIAARRAVERAHRCPQDLAVDANVGVDEPAAGGIEQAVLAAEGALWLWAALLSRRTAEGWEVTDLLERSDSQKAVARTLGISPSAVSQRLRTAGWTEGRRGGILCADLLAAAAGRAVGSTRTGPVPDDGGDEDEDER